MLEEKYHQRVMAGVERSCGPVGKFAGYWVARGHNVLINAVHYAPKRADAHEYADCGADMWFMIPVQVKHLGYSFRDRASWKHKHFAVGNVNAWEKAVVRPHRIAMLSADYRAFASVDVKLTRESWYVEPIKDGRFPDLAPQDNYCCPLDLVEWFEWQPLV